MRGVGDGCMRKTEIEGRQVCVCDRDGWVTGACVMGVGRWQLSDGNRRVTGV